MRSSSRLAINMLYQQSKETASHTTQLQPLPQPLSEWRGEWRPLFADKGKPLPRPLSEWRGEWKLLFANEGGVSLMQGKALLNTTKRPSPIEKGVSFNSRIWLLLFLFSTILQANSSFHSPLHSERGRGRGRFFCIPHPIIIDEICLFNNEKIINSFFFRTFAVG